MSFSKIIEDCQKWIDQEYGHLCSLTPRDYEPPKKKSTSTVKKTNPPIKEGGEFENHFRQCQILILTKRSDPQEMSLISKMTDAIDTRIAKALFLEVEQYESENSWVELFIQAHHLKHILISELVLYSLPNLMKLYQKMPKRQIQTYSLFLLADLKSYLKDPELKKALWLTLLKELR